MYRREGAGGREIDGSVREANIPCRRKAPCNLHVGSHWQACYHSYNLPDASRKRPESTAPSDARWWKHIRSVSPPAVILHARSKMK